MRLLFSFLVIALFIVLGVPLAAPQTPALAHDLSAGTDMSAAKKKKYRQYVYVRHAPPAYVRGPWMDPSLGPDGRPYPNPYPPGTCSEDLGYGRFAPCNFRN